MTTPSLLVLDCAALGWDLVQAHRDLLPDLPFQPMDPVFPAVTCTAQASFRTGCLPAEHGMTANGRFHRELRKPLFWEQSSRLVEGPRIWEGYRRAGGRVGLCFWQQSLGEDVDLLLSPRPIHKHGGGMLQDCFSRPDPLYDELCADIGHRFNLMHYWGPLASRKSSAWITAALEAVLRREDAPGLLLGYLPHLDYDLMRFGPDHPRAIRAVKELGGFLERLLRAARARDVDVLVFGDYAIGPARQAVYPNRLLKEAGWFQTRTIRGMEYPDFYSPGAFALVDHEVAHVYIDEPSVVGDIRRILEQADGVGKVLDRAALAAHGLDHPHTGELVAVAGEGSWFAYPWWTDRRAAPDFASHVDIHNKPGFDPCELFFSRLPPSVSQDTSRVGGTHGRTGPGRQVAWASTVDLQSNPATLPELGAAVERWLPHA